MKVRGISVDIVDKLVAKTIEMGQGRLAGSIGLVNKDGYIDTITELAFGEDLSLRSILLKYSDFKESPVFELINSLPPNAIIIETNPGRTGVISYPGLIDLLDIPMVRIGVKREKKAQVGIAYPDSRLFNLFTKEENLQLDKLWANTMEEEHSVLEQICDLNYEFLAFYQSLEEVEIPSFEIKAKSIDKVGIKAQYSKVESISKELVDSLVQRSIEVEQGVEVGTIAKLVDGHIIPAGRIVTGGMGYLPSRKLASSYIASNEYSLREIYAKKIPLDTVIVHTHPGGTGVMHSGDAINGPDIFGRPIIAIGHNKDGKVKGATVIETTTKLAQLDKEYEQANNRYNDAQSPEEEIKYRNRLHDIDKEYTNLSKPIKIC
ncbi:hypothetical protein [Halonatronum saccharophilum]|uniref:hypothetical protein n=1 Tax=Halonatronum saccharophilum TaxID=150060 RepID=UPI00048374A2|nr:hypothetical protein [Halonatronum saccharophilum]